MRYRRSQESVGTLMLVIATLLVGTAILLDGRPARAINGLGGIFWFVSAALLVLAARRGREPVAQWVALIGLTALVAFVVRPSDLWWAIIGFGLSGFAVAYIAESRPMLWAMLVPALYLPMHIGTAVLRAAYRSATGAEATLRSDPPPTAFLVPLVMVAAALAGGLIAERIRQRRADPVPG